jgi:hypothetical protein
MSLMRAFPCSCMRGVKARLLEIARDGGSKNWTLLIMFELLAARYFAWVLLVNDASDKCDDRKHALACGNGGCALQDLSS